MRLRHATGSCFAVALVAACSGSSSNNNGNAFDDGDGGASSSSGAASSSGGSSGSGNQGSTSGNTSSGASSGVHAPSSSSGSTASTSSGGGSGGASSGTHGDAGVDGAGSSSGSTATSSGSTGTVLDGDAGSCGAAPSGLTSNQSAALSIVNSTRAAMGSPCSTMVADLNTSSTKHCQYYAANATSSTCIADPHVEVSSCTDYVAAQFYTRETDANYTGSPSFEDMAFQDDATQALAEWINSVWHRTPILDPWSRDYGYGSEPVTGASTGPGCDTMDFGVGASSPSDLIVTYPYNGQTGVPTSFNGAQEGPTPPVPPAGWPSGYPVHIYLDGVNPPISGDPHPPPMATITTHEFSVMGGAELDHQWLTPTAYPDSLLDAVILYANAPLTANTTYLVHVAGTTASGGTLDVNVTFTTE